MATLSRTYIEHGYCPIDKADVSIEIDYCSIPRPTDKEGYWVFTKAHNRCYYLNDGRCNAGNKCPIFLAAPSSKTERVKSTQLR